MTTGTHADQIAALGRLQRYLDATAGAPGSACPFVGTSGVSFRTLRLVADLADAKADAR